MTPASASHLKKAFLLFELDVRTKKWPKPIYNVVLKELEKELGVELKGFDLTDPSGNRPKIAKNARTSMHDTIKHFIWIHGDKLYGDSTFVLVVLSPQTGDFYIKA